jgi:hypothetical protein
MLGLYKKLCRHYYQIDPQAVLFYVNAYREMWGEEGKRQSENLDLLEDVWLPSGGEGELRTENSERRTLFPLFPCSFPADTLSSCIHSAERRRFHQNPAPSGTLAGGPWQRSSQTLYQTRTCAIGNSVCIRTPIAEAMGQGVPSCVA